LIYSAPRLQECLINLLTYLLSLATETDRQTDKPSEHSA